MSGLLSLFINSLNVIKARASAIFIAQEQIYANIFAWLIFAETTETRTIAGGSMITFTVIWSELQEKNNTP